MFVINQPIAACQLQAGEAVRASTACLALPARTYKLQIVTLHMKVVEGGPRFAVIALVSGFMVQTASALGSAMLYW
jgi:hypothetical protein